MSVTVDVTIAGRSYPVAATEAEAYRVRELGTQLQHRAAALQEQLGAVQITDAHLLALLSLTLLDELAEAKRAKPAPAPVVEDKAEKELMVRAVEHLTSRVINIAQRLKAA